MFADRQTEGIRKAAIFLASLDPETAKNLLQRLSAEQATEIRRELLKLQSINPDQSQSILSEFIRETSGSHFVNQMPDRDPSNRNNLPRRETSVPASLPTEPAPSVNPDWKGDISADLLHTAPRPSRERVARTPEDHPFSFLQKFTPGAIARLLDEERNFIVAALLQQLPESHANKIQSCFPMQRQNQILNCTRELDRNQQMAPDLLNILETTLLERLLLHES